MVIALPPMWLSTVAAFECFSRPGRAATVEWDVMGEQRVASLHEDYSEDHALAIKHGDEVLDFFCGDVHREVNSRFKVYANAKHYTMQSFQDAHRLSITEVGFKVQQSVNIKGQRTGFYESCFKKSLAFTPRTLVIVVGLLRVHNTTFYIKSFVLLSNVQCEGFMCLLHITRTATADTGSTGDMQLVRNTQHLPAARQRYSDHAAAVFDRLGKKGLTFLSTCALAKESIAPKS